MQYADPQVEVPRVRTAVTTIIGAGTFLTDYQQQVRCLSGLRLKTLPFHIT